MFDNKIKKTRKYDKGMVSVEVVLSFTIFILVVAGIIYFTNIFIVHSKVQFAINSAAHELAGYTYLYQSLGARGAEKQVHSDLDGYADNVDGTVAQVADTLNEIGNLFDKAEDTVGDIQNVQLDPGYIEQLENDMNSIVDTGESAYQSGTQSVEKIQGLFDDPNGTMVGIIYMAANGAADYVKSLGARLAAIAMTQKYLQQGNKSADEFLKGYGVQEGYAGLDFSKSTMFCDEDYRMIDLVVEYDIHIGFLGVLLPDPKVHMVQRVSVSSWVGDNSLDDVHDYLSALKECNKTSTTPSE